MSANPFPGPQPYRAADRARFFGRDAVVRKLENQVLARPATTVFGPSGAGKSSLMQAGVIPALEDSDGLRVARVDTWPGDEAPLRWLVSMMMGRLDLGALPEGEDPLEALEGAIDRAQRRSDRPILIYLDQLEQLFVVERPEAEMKALLQGLGRLIQAGHTDVHLVLSVREDYLGRVRDWTREHAELSAHGFRVGPLSVSEMVKAMCRTAAEGEPAQAWDEAEIRGLMLEVRAPGQRKTDAAEVQTAFGQIVCRALWEQRGGARAGALQGVDAEAIVRGYLETTIEALGPLGASARRLMEDQLVAEDGSRTLRAEKELLQLLPAAELSPILVGLEGAAILHAEEHQGSRYFELGHDWLAKRVFERRLARKKEEAEKRRREEEATAGRLAKARTAQAIAVIAVMVAVMVGALAGWAWMQRGDAIRAQQMAGARELRARGQGGPASMVLADVSNPENARGWAQLVTDILGQGIPTSTLRHGGLVNSAAWSPDGKRVVTASADGTARVWNADGSGDPLVLHGHKGVVNSAAWSPDGTRIVTASEDHTARIWNADGSGHPILLEHGAPVTSAAWSPDGKRVVTASWSHPARVWNADRSGHPIALEDHEGYEGAVTSVAWSPDGKRIVTASEDRTARVWNADGTGDPLVLDGHEAAVTSAAWSPDGTRIVTASDDKTARIWNADGTGDPLVLEGHERSVLSAAWSPDGKRIVTTSEDRTARVWNADGTGSRISLTGHEGPVWSAAWSPDGKRIATASEDRTARIWSADGASSAVVLEGYESSVRSVAWGPDGKRILTASRDRTARVWSAEEARLPEGQESAVASAAWSRDGKRIVISPGDSTVRIIADGPGNPIVLEGHEAGVTSAAWSPDGKRIVTASWDDTARVWNADGAGAPVVLRGHRSGLTSAAWSPDGKRIVTASTDHTARVWNADGSGDSILLAGHEDVVFSAAWSRDGKRIVTASGDNTARVWNADGTGDPLVLTGHGGVASAAWSRDGERVVTASSDNDTRIWPFTIPDLQRALRDATTDCLTAEQRRTYLTESEPEARKRYEACERSHHRTPAREPPASADRKPPPVGLGAANVSGKLPRAIIKRVVQQSSARYRLCYENGVRNNPALRGHVVVRFVIGLEGGVSDVRDGGSDMPDGAVVSCVLRAFYGLSFPAPEGGRVNVTYPILMSPGD